MKHSFIHAALSILVMLAVPIGLFGQGVDMRIDGSGAAKVFLEDLKVDVKVTGSIAATTWTMIFRNSGTRPLEGELTFPLAEGITVSRYAIDINGKMRDAVPVDKAKGTTVLEAIEQRRVDPGLLERVEGNAFRTRIFPLPAGGTRTVVIGYEEALRTKGGTLEYRLPLQFKKEVPKVSIAASVFQGQKPEGGKESALDMDFDRQGYTWNAAKELRDFKSDKPLVFRIPRSETPTALMQEAGNHYYCLINTPPRSGSRERQLTNEITILWDASLSGLKRNHEAEMALLDGYLKRLGNASVHLVLFSNVIQSTRSFDISGGDWRPLKKALQEVVYDGGTQTGVLDLRKLPGKEFLLFSDGLSTYGHGEITAGGAPVYCINAALHADWGGLRELAGRSGGAVINLANLSVIDALQQLTRQPLQFFGIKADRDLEEVFPNIPQMASAGNTVAAVSYKKAGNITLQWGYGKEVTEQQTIALDAEKGAAPGANLARMWATQKIAALDGRYEQNKAVIEALGKRFGLVTRNTSLIVLENLDDYLRYSIEPPEELRETYDRAIKSRVERQAIATQDRLSAAELTFNNLLAWWKQKFEPAEPAEKISSSEPVRAGAGGAGIIGNLKDERGNPVINAYVVITEGGIQKGQAMTDFDGDYEVRPLQPGRYDVKFSYQGKEVTITGVLLVSNQIVTVNALLKPAKTTRAGVTVSATRAYQAPIIDPANPGGRSVRTAEQFDRAPSRNTSDIASLSTQVYQGGASQGLNIGGGRTSATRVVVDGVQLAPGAASFTNQAPGSIESISEGSGNELRERVVTKRKAVSDSIQPRGYLSPASYSFDNTLLGDLRTLPADKQYERYLALREKHLQLPTFYFQAAGHFLSTDRKSLGLRILSNLAELELENYELYKMLGYKLREEGDTAAALEAFRKVLVWRPMDPQSRRDYGLALADAGLYAAAIDTLYAALTVDIDESLRGANGGIDETILCDINGILAAHPEAASANIPRAIIQATPADIRVVINWNTKNTDIDLWVTDPAGEKCYYSHKATAMGGRISADITQGFGPEQFLLHNAGPGKYKIEVNYYGDRQVKIAGPATVMAEVYTGWGAPTQKRQIITLQMKPEDKGGVFVGEFTFERKAK